jgi:hypothetical protein
LGVNGLLLGALTACAEPGSTIIDEFRDRESSDRATELCRSWAGGGIDQEDILVATDSTIREIGEVEDRIGVDRDRNVQSNSPETYVAICLADGDLAAEFDQAVLLYYSMENGGGVPLAGTD